jgi:hypothetical protein
MSGTPFDPVALEAWLDAKFNHMFAQLTTITNRLSSHDQRMARIESSKHDASKGASGAEDHGGNADAYRDDTDDDVQDPERDRTWASFCDRALRERKRCDHDLDRRI